MGSVLIVSHTSEEQFNGTDVRDFTDDGESLSLDEFYRDRPDVPWEQRLAEHPDAFIDSGVPIAHTWHLPPEPVGVRWHQNLARVDEQNEKVRASLEAFLNERLGDLHGRMRSGWWLFGKVRVRVEVCESVPEPPPIDEGFLRALAAALGTALGPDVEARSGPGPQVQVRVPGGSEAARAAEIQMAPIVAAAVDRYDPTLQFSIATFGQQGDDALFVRAYFSWPKE